MISIRYKALVPMALLALVLLALIAVAAVALDESMNLNKNLAGRYHEIEEIRQIEVEASALARPFIADMESPLPVHHSQVNQILDELETRIAELQGMKVVNSEEREVLDFVNAQFVEIRKHSNEYFNASLSDRGARMTALHEITDEHFAKLNQKLRDYHDDEIRQVDDLVRETGTVQTRFRQAVIGAASVTFLLFGVALWSNNRFLVRPILSISKSTAGIADGHFEQHVAVMSNDELGGLSKDINRMALSLQTLYKRMDQLAHTDALTGLMNRRAFEQVAEREVNAAIRYSRNLGLIMIDVDHFKTINDRYGHAIGDEILKFVARTSTMCLRSSDAAFRLGGEEFVLLLQEADGDQILRIAERCRAALADSPWADADHTIPVTASFGVAYAPRDGATLDALLKAADAALYEAKKNGRNRVEGSCCSVAAAG